MTNDLLEKMQWLADKGFVPDMWTNQDEGGNLFLDFNRWHDEQHPYFTESRLWSLLPKKIHVKPNDDASGWLGLSNHQLGYFGAYCSTHARITLNACTDELHTALIDLVIFLIKEGHLKAEVKQ